MIQNARHLVIMFALMVYVGDDTLLTARNPLPRVEQWSRFEISFTASRSYLNPYRDVDLIVTFTHLSTGQNIKIEGFWVGDSTWRVRMAPPLTGDWTYSTASEDPGLNAKSGSFTCAASSRSGFLKNDPENRFALAYTNGTPFFYLGDTAKLLMTNGFPYDTCFKTYVDNRRQTFSYLHVHVLGDRSWWADGTSFAEDAKNEGGYPYTVVDNRYFKLDRVNPAYFQWMDKRMDYLDTKGMVTALVFMDSMQYSVFQTNTDTDIDRYIRYVIARYAAYNVCWVVAKEYLTDSTSINRYNGFGRLVMQEDPYSHPRTIHPPCAELERMGGEGSIHHFAGAPWLNYHLQQYDLGPYGHQPPSGPGILYNSTELNSKILNEKRDGRPVANEEANYIGDGTEPNPDGERWLVRVGAWEVYLAGGFYTAGYRGWLKYIPDTAIATASIKELKHLRTFFTSRLQAWWRMAPENNRVKGLTGYGSPPYGLQGVATNRGFAMGRPGIEHVVLLPAGGAVAFDMTGETGSWTATWLNPRTGTETSAGSVQGGGAHSFRSPDTLDWVLYLRAASLDGASISEAQASERQVDVVAPADSGWPRSPSKIIKNGPSDFTVDPDGHTRYVMVQVVNKGSSSQKVTLRGLITQFGQYLYVQPPGQAWHRVYRESDGGPIIIDALPGKTWVGTVVNFTYRDYVAWVESLNDPRLEKKVIFASGGGKYKAYRLRITAPGGSNKLKISFSRAMHAYEKSGYFMAQGIVSWLLSGDPAANLANIEWTIYPCLDPQAVHDGQDYKEYENLVLDDGRKAFSAVWDPKAGEIPAYHYHYVCDEHMWQYDNMESIRYMDPLGPMQQDFEQPQDPTGHPGSTLGTVFRLFWMYHYEYGIDRYHNANRYRFPTASGQPHEVGEALATFNEIVFIGKDDIDPRERLREHGRLWARAISQACLRFQNTHHYWTSSHVCGFVNTEGATLLPLPFHVLLESLRPASGAVRNGTNAKGLPLVIFRQIYDHGVGMRGGTDARYKIPPGATTFRAMAALDDASEGQGELIAAVDGNTVWRSGLLTRYDRRLAYFSVAGGQYLDLQVKGRSGVLGNWGGARFIASDPEESLLVSTKGGFRSFAQDHK